MLVRRSLHPDVRGMALYAGSTGLAALLTLVVTRMLWRALSPEQFGVWALIDPVMVPAATVVLFGVDHAIVKQLRVDRLPLRDITGGLLACALPGTLLCLVVAAVVASSALHLDWTGALLLTLVGEGLILFVQTAFRAIGAGSAFAIVLLSRNVLYLAALLLVLNQHGSVALPIGLVFMLRGGCVILVSLAALCALRPRFSFDWPLYRDAIRYGSPLLLTTFIFALTDMSDRWVLAKFTGVVAVGFYALHLKLAAIVSQAIVTPFGLWFPPERFKHIADPDGGERFFISTAVVLAAVCSTIAGGVWLARDAVLSLIAPGVPISAFVLACCLFNVVCLAMSQALNVGLLTPGHTGKNSVCQAYTAAASVALAIVFVPLLGAGGAALSRALTGLVLVVLVGAWSARVSPVAFPARLLAAFFAASGLAAWLVDAACPEGGLFFLGLRLVAWSLVSVPLGVLLKLRSGRIARGPAALLSTS